MAAGAGATSSSSSPFSPVFKQPQPVNPNSLPFFSRISEDILVNVFARLEQDPRDLARLACVCRRFKNVIRTNCWRHQCMRMVPTVVSELMSQPKLKRDLIGEPPGGWGSLQKLLVCCPGLRHAGVLLESWDFGLERMLGSSEEYCVVRRPSDPSQGIESVNSSEQLTASGKEQVPPAGVNGIVTSTGFKRKKMKEAGEEFTRSDGPVKHMKQGGLHYHNKVMQDQRIVSSYRRTESAGHDRNQRAVELHQPPVEKTLEESLMIDSGPGCNDDHDRAHLAKGAWSLSREQGNIMLASRFRDDSLFICDWPGCHHQGEKRVYKVFRGIFKNFKQSHVWRNLKDQGSQHTDLSCAFCTSRKTYDMVTSFCLRRSLEYHEDGEPVVRAYVCENGHVAGAWTDRPLTPY
ncbi:hypothetical protein KC19_4G204100 [Ceratodon purpureus]|uniref:F-box domain-containing protein n=1 Tax=Ceratodon purpureus TaxID=3225 RepID=A0A8T0IDC2_CERPU|nr:hypothetical protein KC19_4G204100 [Ceratodon purpureus]